MLERLRGWARVLKRDVGALWLAARDPRTPALAKFVALATAAYALSPIDLIPDFIPVLGLLDDLILVPAGLWLALKLIPADLMAELRAAAETRARPVSRVAAGVVVLLWLAGAVAILWAVAAA
ncbi:MAG: YkvA family protein [Tagaea sp.]|nr:YkvA family protein [Tagaea sp.]